MPTNESVLFPSASSLQEYATLVTSLIRSKSLYKASESAGFGDFLRFARNCIQNGSPEDRLLALSLVGKVAASAKSTKEQIDKVLADETLAAPMPPLRLLKDSDDRYYAAMVWRFTSRDWLPSFLAEAVIDEETAETARQECMDGLLSTTGNFGLSVKRLTAGLKAQGASRNAAEGGAGLRGRSGALGDSASRRLRRILATLIVGISHQRQLVDKSAGPEIRILLRQAFESSGLPKDKRAKNDLCGEVFAVVLQVVHSRFTLALNAETYSPIVTARDWFTGTEWEDLTEGEGASEVALNIQAALEILAESGRVDNELFRCLELVSGGPRRARQLTHQIVERNPGLARETIAWLTGQPIPKRTALSSESQMVRVEGQIGEALLASTEATHSARAVEADLLPQLSIFQSLPSSLLSDFLTHFFMVDQAITSLADMRNLEIFGTFDDVEEFSPLRHEFIRESDLGAKMVTIVRPGVIVRLEDGSRKVVVRARVNPA